MLRGLNLNYYEHSCKLPEGFSEKDIQRIKEYALDRFTNAPTDPQRGSNFLAECYVDAVMSYISSKGWSVIDGKLQKEK
jgi:hypothetical protein